MAAWGLSWLETATQKIREVEHSINAAVGQDDDESTSTSTSTSSNAPPVRGTASKKINRLRIIITDEHDNRTHTRC